MNIVDNLTLITITLAKDHIEAAHLAKCLKVAAQHSAHIVVGDAAHGLNMQEYLTGVPNVFVHRTGGDRQTLVGQLMTAICNLPAPSPSFVLYSEPDKLEFFERQLPRFASALSLEDEIGIVLMARDDAQFSTFPSAMQLTESLTNTLVASFIGTPGDYCYGPMLIRTELLEVLDIDKDAQTLGWGWRFLVMGYARKKGLRIKHIPFAAPCPFEQRGEKSDLYRLQQMSQNVEGLRRGLAAA